MRAATLFRVVGDRAAARGVDIGRSARRLRLAGERVDRARTSSRMCLERELATGTRVDTVRAPQWDERARGEERARGG